MSYSTGGCCPICGQEYWRQAAHGHGICNVYQIGTATTLPPPLTAEDVRRIVREELERWLPRPPFQGPGGTT